MEDLEIDIYKLIGILFIRKSEIEKLFNILDTEDALILNNEYIELDNILENIYNNYNNLNKETLYYEILKYFRNNYITINKYKIEGYNERIK